MTTGPASRSGKVRRGLLAVLVGAMALAGSPAQPALAATPLLRVSPDTDLFDGQEVTFGLTGLDEAAQVTFAQCPAGVGSVDECGFATSTHFLGDDAGPIAGTFIVSTILRNVWPPEADDATATDCRVAACELVAFDDSGSSTVVAARAALGFDPNAPLIDIEATVTPSTGLVDGQTVRVQGSGFRTSGEGDALLCSGFESDTPACRLLTILEIDEQGSLDQEVRVRARIPVGVDEAVDCRDPKATCHLVLEQEGVQAPVLLPLSFRVDGALLPLPSISVTPSTGLGDQTDVELTGTDFEPDAELIVVVCSGSRLPACDSDSAAFLSADGTGQVSGTITVSANFEAPSLGFGLTEDGPPVDCRQDPGCVVLAMDQSGEQVSTPISFGPPGQPTVPNVPGVPTPPAHPPVDHSNEPWPWRGAPPAVPIGGRPSYAG